MAETDVKNINEQLLAANIRNVPHLTLPKNPMAERALKMAKTIFKDKDSCIVIDNDLAELIPLLYSDAKNPNIICNALIYNQFVFYLDDHLEQNPKEYSVWNNYFKSKTCSGIGNLEKMFLIFIDYTRKQVGENDLEYLLRVTDEGFAHSEWIEQVHNGTKSLNEDEFVELRSTSFVCQALQYFLLKDSGININEDILKNEDIIEFNLLLHKQGFLMNEMFSLKKEIQEGQMRFNYIYIKMFNKNINAEKAIDETVSEFEACNKQAKILANKLSKLGDSRIDSYTRGHLYAIEGMKIWSKICKKYGNNLV